MSAPRSFLHTLEAARRGDEAAVNALLEAYYPTVERMAHRALLDETPYRRQGLVSLFSTGDIVQETCRSVMRDLSKFEGTNEASFVCYLTAVVHNRLHDLLRFHRAARRDRRRIEGDRTSFDVGGDAAAPDRHVASSEEAQIFLATLGELPKRERGLLVGKLEHDRTFVELAEELGYPSPDAARKAYHKAHARLLVRLRRHGVRGPDGGATQ